MTRRTCILVATLFLALPGSALAQTISESEMKDAFNNKNYTATVADGRNFSVKFRADNTSELTFGPNSDTGVWRLSPGGYCVKWARTAGGAERCFTVQKGEGGTLKVINSDGSPNSTLKP